MTLQFWLLDFRGFALLGLLKRFAVLKCSIKYPAVAWESVEDGMMKTIAYMLMASFVIGCLITLITTRFFFYEYRAMGSLLVGGGRSIGCFRTCIKMGYPLVWYIADITWQRGGPILLEPLPQIETVISWQEKAADKILVDNLLVDIAYHTFAALGVVGILLIETKKSELKVYGPVPHNPHQRPR